MAVTSLRAEVTDLLSRLIRVDTTNPPGNETAAAELLRGYLEPFGVECELYARVPERASLVARIRGTGDGPTLLFLSHTDVVLADASEWSVPPFSGEVRDGEVWGRGALDMKGQVAASAVAIASLAREGFEPAGDLIFAATADEEVGDGFGLSWLCEAHPDAVRCDYAVNEGGGDRLELGGSVYYVVTTAEKLTAPFEINVHGRSGHASMPGIADNALVKAARLIERIAGYRPEPQIQPEVEAFLRTVLGEVPTPADVVARAAALHRHRRRADRAAARPDVLADDDLRVAQAERHPGALQGDRRLPAPARADAGADRGHVREMLGSDVDYDLEFLKAEGGTRSALDTPLWSAVESFVSQLEPGAAPVPVICAGFTDSHWLREAFGAVAYGFFPYRTMAPELAATLIHSADERVPASDLELGVDWLRHVAHTIGG